MGFLVVSDRVTTRRVGAPLAALFLGFPLWWLLGIQTAMWAVVAAVAAVWMLRNRAKLLVPPGYGFLAVFIGWVLISGLMLTGPRFAMAYGLRLVLYTSVVVLGFYVWNILRRGFPIMRVVTWLTWFWAFAIVLSVPGLLFPNGMFTSPFGLVLGAAGFHDPYIVALTSPHFAETDSLYGVARPSPLFEFTNLWGGAVGILTPVAVYAAIRATTVRGRALVVGLLVLSVWPIVVSVNRGCWISIVVAVGYFMVRRALARDVRAVAGVILAGLACAALVLFTPLSTVVSDRLDNGNNDTRANLYTASFQLAAQSPIFGHGAPQPSTEVADNNNVSVGTHGQFWTILVSQGYVGVLLFTLGVLALWWYSRPRNGRVPEVWLHATGLIVLVQMFVYDVIPVPLMVLLICNAVITARNRELSWLTEPAGIDAQKGQMRVPLHA